MSKKKENKEEEILLETEEIEETLHEAEELAEDEKLKKELQEQKEKYLRLAAEYDNFRKRTSNEKLSIYDNATANAVMALLPVADSMDQALQNLKDSPPEFVKGIELIKNQLDSAFEKLKTEAFAEVGDEFDPNIHNAISKVESEGLEENQIAAVFQKGYKIGDKIVRHAMVQVAG